VSGANVDILVSLPRAQEKIAKLTKYECLDLVHKIEIETGLECEDVDREARLKLLFELQETVQGVVMSVVKILDVHEMLTAHVDRLISPLSSQHQQKTEESD
jgi:hypothetical protein